MTDQQRTARIEFVKKLLVANGFVLDVESSKINGLPFFDKKEFLVSIFYDWFSLYGPNYQLTIMTKNSLKPLRDFIKLSNQK